MMANHSTNPTKIFKMYIYIYIYIYTYIHTYMCVCVKKKNMTALPNTQEM